MNTILGTILLAAASFNEQLLSPALAFQPSPSRQNFRPNSPEPLKAVEVIAAIDGSQAMATAGITGHASVSTAINSFFQSQPYLASFLTCSVKASAADAIAQRQEEGSSDETSTELEPVSDIDFSRNLGFLLYGGLYTGMAQNFLYTVLYPMWFGTEESASIIFKEVMADNFIFGPLLCLPIAYAFKAAFTSKEGLTKETLVQGLEKYIEDVRERGLMMKYWTIWMPVQFLTFSVIPSHFRVAFVAVVSFFWIFILSSVAASERETSREGEGVAP